MKDYIELNEKNIVSIDEKVLNSFNYGKESQIIHDILNKYPENTDLNTVAMKIAVIDLTNSTHLSQYKNKISLYDLANFILNIDNFDERVKNGDPELVNLIARNIGKVNLFSFASKYCTYHNFEIYGNDNYSIFDGVVKNTLPFYKKNITKNRIESWRKSYDYKSFNDCIGQLLDDNNIHIKNRRRMFDHFMWYPNRKK